MPTATQKLVLAFLWISWVVAASLLIAFPHAFEFKFGAGVTESPAFRALFGGLLAAFLVTLSMGILRRWRWTFWLIVIAFLAGFLRVPASLLELSGAIPTDQPGWYITLQGAIGVAQLAVALVLLKQRRASVAWGPRRR